MSVEFVDIARIREVAEHKSRVERAIESRKVAKQAEQETHGPFSGLFKGATGQRQQEQQQPPKYVYHEYSSLALDLLAKAADSQCAGGGVIEEEIKRSRDVNHGLTALCGGGVENDWIGTAGAIAAICSRNVALRKMGGQQQKNKPPPPKNATAAAAPHHPQASGAPPRSEASPSTA